MELQEVAGLQKRNHLGFPELELPAAWPPGTERLEANYWLNKIVVVAAKVLGVTRN